MPSYAETFSDSLLACLESEFNLLPAAVRPASYEKIAGQFFIADVDPRTGVDKCCAGTGWVRVGDAYPTDEFPEPITYIKSNSCAPTAWALSIELGVARCYPGYGDPGGPTSTQHAQARATDLLDLQTLEKALCCWAKTLTPKGLSYIIPGITIGGPEGVCVFRTATVLVETPTNCC